MSRRIDPQLLVAAKEIVAAPVEMPRACTDHSFGLPTGIYATMALLFAGAIAILATAFRHNMLVSYGIVFAFLFAFFAVPSIFVKASPADGAKTLRWSEFRERGIATATGHTGAGEATVLALALPFFIFCWAVAIAIIAATIR
jgi:hypothetical protein